MENLSSNPYVFRLHSYFLNEFEQIGFLQLLRRHTLIVALQLARQLSKWCGSLILFSLKFVAILNDSQRDLNNCHFCCYFYCCCCCCWSRNLALKFDQKWVSYSWDIVVVDVCFLLLLLMLLTFMKIIMLLLLLLIQKYSFKAWSK